MSAQTELLNTTVLLWKLVLEAKSRGYKGTALDEADGHLDRVREWTVAKSMCKDTLPLLELLEQEDGPLWRHLIECRRKATTYRRKKSPSVLTISVKPGDDKVR